MENKATPIGITRAKDMHFSSRKQSYSTTIFNFINNQEKILGYYFLLTQCTKFTAISTFPFSKCTQSAFLIKKNGVIKNKTTKIKLHKEHENYLQKLGGRGAFK